MTQSVQQYNAELCRLYGYVDIMKYIKIKRLKWIEYIERIEKIQPINQIFYQRLMGDRFKEDDELDGSVSWRTWEGLILD